RDEFRVVENDVGIVISRRPISLVLEAAWKKAIFGRGVFADNTSFLERVKIKSRRLQDVDQRLFRACLLQDFGDDPFAFRAVDVDIEKRILGFEASAHRAGFFQVARRVKNYLTIFFCRFDEFVSCRRVRSSRQGDESSNGEDQTNRLHVIRFADWISTISNNRSARQPEARLRRALTLTFFVYCRYET